MIQSSLILAAGRGSRLGEITRDRPKGAVELWGKTLIEHAESALEAAALPAPVYVTGYMKEYFENLGKATVFNPDWSRTNMFVSMLVGLREVSLPCLVVYSDIFLGEGSLNNFRNLSSPAIGYIRNWLRHWEARYQDPHDDAESFLLDETEHVVKIGDPLLPGEAADGQFAGIFVVTQELLDEYEKLFASGPQFVNKLSSTEVFSLLIRQGFCFRAVRVREPWFEIDKRSDLDFAITELGVPERDGPED